MPYLAEFLTEKLNKPVTFFEPLRGISQSETAQSTAADFIHSNPYNLGELVGGALSLTSAPQTKISLLPPSILKKRQFAKRLPSLVSAGVIFLATLACWYGYALKATAVTREETTKLSSVVSEENRVSAQIKELLAKQSQIEQKGAGLLSVIRLRESYPLILAELSARIPERFLWITEIQPGGDTPVKGAPSKPAADSQITALTVKGLYLDNPRQASVIDDMVTSLQSSEIFAVEEKEKSKIITQRGSPNGEYWAYPFSLRVPLRTPITPLP